MTRYVLALFCLFAGASPHAVHAHALLINTDTTGGQITVTAGFEDGRAASGATVRVSGAQNRVLLIGVTDADGRFGFGAHLSQDGYLIEVDAGEGHTGYRILTPNDLSQDHAIDQ